MIANIYSFSLVWDSIGNGCYPRVTSSSAVPTSPRWLRPPVVPSAPTAPPWALASQTGIGNILLVLALITTLRGMVRKIICYVYVLCIILYMCIIPLLPVLSPSITSAAMPQPYCDDLYHYFHSGSLL